MKKKILFGLTGGIFAVLIGGFLNVTEVKALPEPPERKYSYIQCDSNGIICLGYGSFKCCV